MAVHRAAVFMDGGYLNKVTRELDKPKLDFGAFTVGLATGVDILRTYYYDCLPWQGATPTAEDASRVSKAQAFYASLGKIPRFEVRLGKLERRGIDSETGQAIFEQKRVDILLAVDLVRLSLKGSISHAFILQ